VSTVSPFLEITPPAGPVAVTFDGETLMLPDGENLAAALLASGHRSLRATPVSGRPRGPFCMMGACFDCLVEIDGVTVQACMRRVSEGLVIRRAHGKAAP
jgi:predicted molibdopterin-dependent oxidoreductase YjgC